MALDLDYWNTEVASFNKRLPALTSETERKVRMLLRGLAVLATEFSKDHPEDADKVMSDIHACLRMVHDHGIELDIESWIWNHASPEIASSVAKEFGIPIK